MIPVLSTTASVTLAVGGLLAILLSVFVDLDLTVANVGFRWARKPDSLQRKALAVVGVVSLLAGVFFWLYKPTSKVSIAGVYRDLPGDGCFSGDPGSNLVFEGQTVAIEDLVACNYGVASEEASRTYLFDIPSQYANQRITGLSGTFGIDEADGVQHPQARAVWTVNQGGRQICAVEATWKAPGRCVVDEHLELQADQPLEIRETLVSRGDGQDKKLYLGIAEPRLLLKP